MGILDFHIIEALRKYSSLFSIVFVSDCKIKNKDKKKINFVEKIISKEHSEMDFGSWKLGLEFLKNKNIENLLLVNDSIIGPFIDLKKIFDNMKNKKVDFWGITSAGTKSEFHIQSYFLFFNKNVFYSQCFKRFFQKVTKLSSKSELVRLYEIGLTQMLIDKGFKCSSFLKNFKKDIHSNIKFLSFIEEGRLPFLKVKHFVSNPFRLKKVYKALNLIKNSKELIDYVKRVNRSNDLSHLYYYLPQFKYVIMSSKLILVRAKFVADYKFWRFYIKFLGVFIFFIIFPVKFNSNTYKSDNNY